MNQSDQNPAPSPSPASGVGGVPFRDAFDAMQLGVTIADPMGRIVYVNAALAAMHGYEPKELLGKPSRIFGAQSARQTLTTQSLSEVTRWKRETLNRKKDGSTFPVLLMSAVFEDDNDRTIGIVTVCEDISERKQQEESGALQSLRDPLTGLASRLFLLQLIKRVVHRRERHPDHLFAVLYVDLNRFTMINESLGHDAGDIVLRTVAERLALSIRPTDVIARLAGDEFAALLDGVRDESDGTRVAERFIDAFDEPVRIGERDLYIDASIGIAMGDSGHVDPEQYLADASAAMKRARTIGQSTYEVFDRNVHRRATGRLRLETELRHAIDHGDLLVLYQPIVDVATARVVGFEALVRWKHADRGLVSPGEFIPVAEETGLIIPIGSWVLRTACAQLAHWRGQFPDHSDLTINVNLSARHLGQADVVEEVLLALGETGLPPQNLKLEITETMLMEDAEAQLLVLKALREAGIGVVIDDFGTGYSSLSYLRQFHVDTLKIDRSFLGEPDDEDAWELVEMIIGLARGMGVSVVAEGVETEAQHERLRKLDCDKAQGFLFSRPIDADAATDLLGSQPTT